MANEGGTWERVEVIIYDEGNGAFRLECNPSMVTDKGQGMFEDQTQADTRDLAMHKGVVGFLQKPFSE